jgi:hypothetical protein
MCSEWRGTAESAPFVLFFVSCVPLTWSSEPPGLQYGLLGAASLEFVF